VAVLVTVCVLAGAVVVCVWAGAVAVCVSVVGVADSVSVPVAAVVLVTGSDLACAAALFACAAAPEIAVLAFRAALETAPLVDPAPHPPSGTVAIPSAARTNGSRAAEGILDRLARDGQDRLPVVSRNSVI
jgi:hypothetical protein